VKCPFCGHEEDKVVESRTIAEGTEIRRRRECLKCGERFTSYERIEQEPILIIKKDGRREHFDRIKLKNGILKACEKRPVSIENIDAVIDKIEKKVHNEGLEVESKFIGSLVMKELEKIDKVAFIRFASVYREFKDIGEFEKIVKNL
jgi:transcriptional repressor NrdR